MVSGRNRYAVAARVRLIQGFSHASIIILVDSPVVHKFNSPLINYGPALGTSVHDGHLPVVVSDCDRDIYWLVISFDAMLGYHFYVPGGSVVEDTLLHCKTY